MPGPRSQKAFSGGRRKYVHVASGAVPYGACPRKSPFLLVSARLLVDFYLLAYFGFGEDFGGLLEVAEDSFEVLNSGGIELLE